MDGGGYFKFYRLYLLVLKRKAIQKLTQLNIWMNRVANLAREMSLINSIELFCDSLTKEVDLMQMQRESGTNSSLIYKMKDLYVKIANSTDQPRSFFYNLGREFSQVTNLGLVIIWKKNWFPNQYSYLRRSRP